MMNVVMSFPPETDMPQVGDEIASPVNGGRDWLTLGTIQGVYLGEDGRKYMAVAIPDGVEISFTA